MKKSFSILCLLLFVVITNGYAQQVLANTRQVRAINMNDKDCLHVIDGVVSGYSDAVPQQQLAHFEQVYSQEKLERLGFGKSACVMVRSTADLDIENYIYRQVHAQVQQVGAKYKIPIVVNEQLIAAHTDRRNRLAAIKEAQIKEIRFLNKTEARAKYGDRIVFGVVEITV